MNCLLRLTILLCLSLPLSLFPACSPRNAAAETPKQVLVTPAQMRQHLENFLDQQRSEFPGISLDFREMELPEAFAVPPGRLTCQVTPSDPGLLASSRFNLIYRVDGRAVRNIAVSATLTARAPVVVTTGQLNRGTVLREEHIELAERDVSRLRAPLFHPEELLGQRLRRTLGEGEALERSSVNFPPVIRRGEIVTITVQTGSLLITAKGLAQQNGDTGDLIRVRNQSSSRDLLCRITGPSSVMVEL